MTVIEQRTMESVMELNRKIPELSLRDIFALSAINGIVGNYYLDKQGAKEMADRAYLVADAMLEARGNK